MISNWFLWFMKTSFNKWTISIFQLPLHEPLSYNNFASKHYNKVQGAFRNDNVSKHNMTNSISDYIVQRLRSILLFHVMTNNFHFHFPEWFAYAACIVSAYIDLFCHVNCFAWQLVAHMNSGNTNSLICEVIYQECYYIWITASVLCHILSSGLIFVITYK